MVKLLRWLLGYVSFRFSGGFTQGFAERCRRERLGVFDLCADEKGLTGKILARRYRLLRPAARSSGGKVQILQKRGAPFVFARFRGRMGLLAGVVACILLFSYLSSFVWTLQVKGCETLSEESVLDFLETQGFHIGVKKRDVDNDKICTAAMAVFDDVAWIHININGTNAVVEISESVHAPQLREKTPANIVAAKDGEITEIICTGGDAVVQPGSAVTRGDLLITGVYTSQADEKNHFETASGSVTAKVHETLQVTVPRSAEEKRETGRKSVTSLYFFGLTVPLGFAKETAGCTVTSDLQPLVLGGKTLPVGIRRDRYVYYEKNTYFRTDEELLQLARREMQQKRADYAENAVILSEKETSDLTETACTLKLSLTAVEEIGERRALQLDFSQPDDETDEAGNAPDDAGREAP